MQPLKPTVIQTGTACTFVRSNEAEKFMWWHTICMCFEDMKQEKNMENISVLMHYEYGFIFSSFYGTFS